MGLKGKIEAVIYAAEEPISLNQIALLVKEPVLQELATEQERALAEAAEQAQGDGEATTEPVDDRTAGNSPTVSVDDSSAPESTPLSEEAAVRDEQPPADASETAAPPTSPKRKKTEVPPEVRVRVKAIVEELTADYANNDRGMEIRHVAGGYRMATKPEHHDIVKSFAKSLKPPLRLSLPALETLAVVAYKQPVTAPEVSDIRGVDSQGVMATLLERKLVTTAGRKAVIGRPILYKTTKEFLLRFGLNDVSELPSMEEFEKLAMEQSGLFVSEQETEPQLSPEEASARLEQVSVAEEAAYEGDAGTATSETDQTTTAETAPETEAQSEPVPSEETHQS